MVFSLGKSGSPQPAKIVDNALVLSLENSTTPRLWRIDLDELNNAALEIREGEEGHIIGFAGENKTFKEIATFINREDALDILKSASAALMAGVGVALSPQQGIAKPPKNWLKLIFKLAMILLGLFLLFVLFVFIMVPITDIPVDESGLDAPGGFVDPAALNQQPQTPQDRFNAGQPVSVDELFAE